jgi:hypothetical protein
MLFARHFGMAPLEFGSAAFPIQFLRCETPEHEIDCRAYSRNQADNGNHVARPRRARLQVAAQEGSKEGSDQSHTAGGDSDPERRALDLHLSRSLIERFASGQSQREDLRVRSLSEIFILPGRIVTAMALS